MASARVHLISHVRDALAEAKDGGASFLTVPKSPVSSSSSRVHIPIISQLLPSLSPSFSDTGHPPNTLLTNSFS